MTLPTSPAVNVPLAVTRPRAPEVIEHRVTTFPEPVAPNAVTLNTRDVMLVWKVKLFRLLIPEGTVKAPVSSKYFVASDGKAVEVRVLLASTFTTAEAVRLVTIRLFFTCKFPWTTCTGPALLVTPPVAAFVTHNDPSPAMSRITFVTPAGLFVVIALVVQYWFCCTTFVASALMKL